PCPCGVAEADDSYVLRPAHTARTKRPEHSCGENHAAAEDRVGPRGQRQQVERALPSIVEAERPQANVLLIEVKAGLLEGRSIPRQALARRRDALEPVDQRDAAMAAFDEQPGRTE